MARNHKEKEFRDVEETSEETKPSKKRALIPVEEEFVQFENLLYQHL